jgi:hypothetical protein
MNDQFAAVFSGLVPRVADRVGLLLEDARGLTATFLAYGPPAILGHYMLSLLH